MDEMELVNGRRLPSPKDRGVPSAWAIIRRPRLPQMVLRGGGMRPSPRFAARPCSRSTTGSESGGQQ